MQDRSFGFPPSSITLEVSPVRFGEGPSAEIMREVAVETPVNIVFGNMPYAVMMASPSDLEDFVTGFSLTEGIIRRPDEIRGVTVTPQEDGVVVTVDLAPGRFREHLARRRNLSGRTSCGLCGVETMEELPMACEATASRPPIAVSSLRKALDALDDHQPLNRETRSVHAAAWCDRNGTILVAREDVGRHNALDKLIGARLREVGEAGDGFVLVTSRASFEMVEKTAIFGAPMLATISAPTSLAVERARKLGLTLASFARAGGCTVFAGALEPEA